MTVTPQTIHDIATRGQALYEHSIRPHVEPQHSGKFLVLDVDTGEYEIDADDLHASDRLLERVPNALLYGIRIGSAAAYKLGAHSRHPRP